MGTALVAEESKVGATTFEAAFNTHHMTSAGQRWPGSCIAQRPQPHLSPCYDALVVAHPSFKERLGLPAISPC